VSPLILFHGEKMINGNNGTTFVMRLNSLLAIDHHVSLNDHKADVFLLIYQIKIHFQGWITVDKKI
jgi:hypothetical protein